MTEENVLGGVSSANLKKGLIAGYGLYATDRRIIGVMAREKGVALGMTAGLAGFLTTKDIEKLTRDEKAKLISELEEKKDFEVLKDRVAEIELKKPGFIGLGGQITIRTSAGEEIKIGMYGKKEYEIILDSMQRFKPEAVRTI
jgi:hypothetical protein